MSTLVNEMPKAKSSAPGPLESNLYSIVDSVLREYREALPHGVERRLSADLKGKLGPAIRLFDLSRRRKIEPELLGVIALIKNNGGTMWGDALLEAMREGNIARAPKGSKGSKDDTESKRMVGNAASAGTYIVLLKGEGSRDYRQKLFGLTKEGREL